MLVCSVHDPAIFDQRLFAENDHYEAIMASHLRDVQLCHLLVVDEGGTVWREIIALAEKVPWLGMYLNACISESRIVYLPSVQQHGDKVRQWLDQAGSAEAVGLIAHKQVDVLVAANQTVDAMSIEKMPLDKTCMLRDYHKSPSYQRESLSRGARALNTLTKKEFLDDVITPVVWWAEACTVIDKMIVRAAYGDPGGQRKEQSNFSDFKETIHAILGIWRKGPRRSEGTFRIISEHTNQYIGDELAKQLADKLGLADACDIEICLKNKEELKVLNHDRYLVTNNDICIGFTRGFDLLDADFKGNKQNMMCGISDVYVRQHQNERDAVNDVMLLRNQGRWSGKT